MSNYNLPKWVNTVLTNEFENDPYWVEGIEQDCPEAYAAISNIQKSPSNVQTYLESLEIYNKYIGEIVEYYGGQQSIDAYIASQGKMPPGYCPPPKLKLRKETKAFLKSGVVPQKMGEFDAPCTGDELVEITNKMYGDEIPNEPVKAYQPGKKMRKRLSRIDNKLKGKNAYNRAYNNDLDNVVDYDAIYQYAYATENKDASLDATSEIDVKELSYTELAEYYDEQEKYEQEESMYPTEYVSSKATRRGGSAFYVSSSMTKANDWAKVLIDNGFEKGLRKYAKKLDSTTRRYIEHQTGFDVKSAKSLKKKKKKYDAYMEELESINGKKGDSVRSLSQALSRHKSGIGSDVDSKIFDDIISRRK